MAEDANDWRGTRAPANGASENEQQPFHLSRMSPVRSLRRRVLSLDFEADVDLRSQLPAEAKTPTPGPLLWWEHRVQDVWIVVGLAVRLYSYLFMGVRWWFKFVRLVAFTTILMPGFSQMVVFYLLSPRLIRSVVYGANPRNRCDVYLPRRKWRLKGPCPVVIYVTGGAWTIGYKAWGALFGRRLSQRGCLVFCLDYRNFPQGSALHMLEDINTGVKWALDHLHLYGGDPQQVFLVGQSAGGHLTSMALLSQAQRAVAAAVDSGSHYDGPVAAEDGPAAAETAATAPTAEEIAVGAVPAWDVSQIRGFVGVSGAYNLMTLAEHLHKRGLYKNMFNSIMVGPDGRPALERLSPALVARNELTAAAAAALPPVLLLHGTSDKSVPIGNAEEYASALREAGAACTLKAYVGKTHTQPIVEDPMRGGQDELMDEVLSLIRGQKCVNLQFPMLPSAFIDVATFVCPF